jgi:hypothetical protein
MTDEGITLHFEAASTTKTFHQTTTRIKHGLRKEADIT